MAKAKTAEKTSGNVYVTKEFRDKDNFEQLYSEGDDVTGTFSEEREAYLIEQGVIAKESTPAKPETKAEEAARLKAEAKAQEEADAAKAKEEADSKSEEEAK